MATLKVTQIGNSLGVILPKELLARLKVDKGDALYIRGMAVVPSVRGSGIGSGLLREVESVARAAGQRRLRLSTTPFLSSAIQLYESFGFQRTDADPHDLFGTPLFTMEKALTSP